MWIRSNRKSVYIFFKINLYQLYFTRILFPRLLLPPILIVMCSENWTQGEHANPIRRVVRICGSLCFFLPYLYGILHTAWSGLKHTSYESLHFVKKNILLLQFAISSSLLSWFHYTYAIMFKAVYTSIIRNTTETLDVSWYYVLYRETSKNKMIYDNVRHRQTDTAS